MIRGKVTLGAVTLGAVTLGAVTLGRLAQDTVTRDRMTPRDSQTPSTAIQDTGATPMREARPNPVLPDRGQGRANPQPRRGKWALGRQVPPGTSCSIKVTASTSAVIGRCGRTADSAARSSSVGLPSPIVRCGVTVVCRP